jgi:ZIP family zinc transporter
MAFGGGVLISALSFDLMEEAYNRGGFGSTAIGFLGGATLYTLANWYLRPTRGEASKTIAGPAA